MKAFLDLALQLLVRLIIVVYLINIYSLRQSDFWDILACTCCFGNIFYYQPRCQKLTKAMLMCLVLNYSILECLYLHSVMHI